MATKIGRNEKCSCGSGLKFKKCCINKYQQSQDNGMQSLFDKFANGELPFRAEVSSENDATSSMIVTNAKVVIDGIETTLINDEITLSVNSIDGDKQSNSSASISVPVKRNFAPEIILEGNANINNNNSSYSIKIDGSPKKLKINSEKGLFAIIRVVEQRNANYYYYDVYFGAKGKEDVYDEGGNKIRPHIAFYPNGNGKFIRFSGYKCEINSKLDYCPTNKTIYPSTISIHSAIHNESIILYFNFNQENRVVTLMDAKFEA